MLALALIAGAIGIPAIAETADHKRFSTSISPDNVIEGTHDFTFFVKNESASTGLGSVNIDVPVEVEASDLGGFVVQGNLNCATRGQPSQRCTANLVDVVIAGESRQQIQLRNLNLAPGNTVRVTFRGEVACENEDQVVVFAVAVKQSNNFQGTGNDLLPVASADAARPLTISACDPVVCEADTEGFACTITTSEQTTVIQGEVKDYDDEDGTIPPLTASIVAGLECDTDGHEWLVRPPLSIEYDAPGMTSPLTVTVTVHAGEDGLPSANLYWVCFESDPDDPMPFYDIDGALHDPDKEEYGPALISACPAPDDEGVHPFPCMLSWQNLANGDRQFTLLLPALDPPRFG